MRKGYTASPSSLLCQSQGTVMATLFFFAAGLSSGVFVELFMGQDSTNQIADYLTSNLLSGSVSGASLPSVFLRSAANNFGLLLVILLAGITVVGFPAALLAVAYKGMALGFSSALLIDSMGGKGAVVILLSMVPQNLLLMPALLIAAVAAVNLSAQVFSGRQKGIKKSLGFSAGPYLSIFAVLAAAVLAGCLIEAFIAPVLLQLAG